MTYDPKFHGSMHGSRSQRAQDLQRELRLRKEYVQDYVEELTGQRLPDDPFFLTSNKYLWKHYGFIPYRVRDYLSRIGMI